jgi:hypothetical protein
MNGMLSVLYLDANRAAARRRAHTTRTGELAVPRERTSGRR